MGNLYNHTKDEQANMQFTWAMIDRIGNLPREPALTDYAAPIVRSPFIRISAAGPVISARQVCRGLLQPPLWLIVSSVTNR